MRYFLTFVLGMLMIPACVHSETLVAKRTVPSRTLLTAQDFMVLPKDTPGALSDLADILGLEARRVLYKGRPVARSDVGPAAVIERNQMVTLIYANDALIISAEARSLDRAGIGDLVRVMNLGSRKTVVGVAQTNGAVLVGGLETKK